jgi:hypothetical protein
MNYKNTAKRHQIPQEQFIPFLNGFFNPFSPRKYNFLTGYCIPEKENKPIILDDIRIIK